MTGTDGDLTATATPGRYDPPTSTVLSTAYQTGAVLYASNVKTQIENIVIEAGVQGGPSQADFGIYLFKSHGAQLRNVTVRHAAKGGLWSDSTNAAVFADMIAERNRDGMVIIDANACEVQHPTVQLNRRNGLVITKKPGSIYSGGMSVVGGVSQVNGSTELGGHGVYIKGIRSTISIMSMWVEGNRLDGMRAESAHNVNLLYNKSIGDPVGTVDADGDSTNHAISLHECSHCIVRGNQVGKALTSPPNYEDIWVTGDSTYPDIAQNIYNSGYMPTDWLAGASGSLEVVFVEGTTKARVTQHQLINMHADAPPLVGVFRVGDIVWNRTPAIGEPAGWTCASISSTGACTSWLKMGNLTL